MAHLTIEIARQFLTSQLDPQTHAQWEGHIRSCQRCRNLIAAEQAWSNLLDLGDEEGAASEPEPQEGASPLRVEELGARPRARRRLTTLAGVFTTALFALLLVCQLASGPNTPSVPAESLRISPDLQSKVIANLDALLALEREPWLAYEYDTVRMLDTFISKQQEPVGP